MHILPKQGAALLALIVGDIIDLEVLFKSPRFSIGLQVFELHFLMLLGLAQEAGNHRVDVLHLSGHRRRHGHLRVVGVPERDRLEIDSVFEVTFVLK